MTLTVYCIVGSYKKNNIILLCDVSQVGPIRSTRTSIDKRPILSFVSISSCGFLSQALHNFPSLVCTCDREIERVYLLVMLGTIYVGSILLGERSSS